MDDTGTGDREPGDVQALLGGLSLSERASLTSGRDVWTAGGVPRLGIPALRLCDGPHGVRRQRRDDGFTLGDNLPATCFPTGSALAATWDPELVLAVGTALGIEARARDVHVLLGPAVNIKRTPLCGRSFEYLSEDPLLSSSIAAAWVSGVQATGVAACPKHYALNNQEHRRYTVDVLVDERALRELYLAAWEPVVRAGPWALMAAYNKVAGTHCTENRLLLTSFLREQWGYDGVVVSDWGAVTDRAAGLAAGLDLEMPGHDGVGDDEVAAAVAEGRLPAEALDRAARAVLALSAHVSTAPADGIVEDVHGHHGLGRRAAIEGTVLLRNVGETLPLDPTASVAVVGALAAAPRFQGGGSSAVTPHWVDDALTSLRSLMHQPVVFAAGCTADGRHVAEGLMSEAVRAVRGCDAVVVFVGLPSTAETEGRDRADLRLPAAHDALVEAVAAACDRVVVVLSCGAPVEMPWVSRVAAVVQGNLAGQAAGSALAQVLIGLEEPAGRLAETYPVGWADSPLARLPNGPRRAEYRESVFVGYRYHDAAGGEVLFPFGHGLSYTTFRYDDLTLSTTRADADRDLAVDVEVTVTNTGARAGSDVVQVYVAPPAAAVGRPPQELRAFRKVRLAPATSARVRMRLERQAFARWSVETGTWVVDPGFYRIRVGASSRDIRAVVDLEIRGAPVPPDPFPPDARALDDASFRARLRRPLPPDLPPDRAAVDRDTPLADLRHWPAGRLLHAALRRGASRVAADRDDSAMLAAMVEDMPLRLLPMFSGWAVTPRGVDGLLALVQGRYVTGAWLTLGAALGRFRRARRA